MMSVMSNTKVSPPPPCSPSFKVALRSPKSATVPACLLVDRDVEFKCVSVSSDIFKLEVDLIRQGRFGSFRETRGHLPLDVRIKPDSCASPRALYPKSAIIGSDEFRIISAVHICSWCCFRRCGRCSQLYQPLGKSVEGLGRNSRRQVIISIIQLIETIYIVWGIHPGTAVRNWHCEFPLADGCGSVKPVRVSRVAVSVRVPCRPHPVNVAMV